MKRSTQRARERSRGSDINSLQCQSLPLIVVCTLVDPVQTARQYKCFIYHSILAMTFIFIASLLRALTFLPNHFRWDLIPLLNETLHHSSFS